MQLPRILFLLSVLSFQTSIGQAQSQQEMNQDAAKSAAAADKELNAVYKKVMAGLDDEGKALLKASQLAWIAFRDADAKFAADEMRDGSAAPLLYSGTLARLTKQRVARLKECLGEAAAPETNEPAKVTYKKCEAYSGSSKLYFTDSNDEEITVSVMNKTQRSGMGKDEPFIKYPEKMVSTGGKGSSDANPAMVGKSFLLIKDPDGEIIEIKQAP